MRETVELLPDNGETLELITDETDELFDQLRKDTQLELSNGRGEEE